VITVDCVLYDTPFVKKRYEEVGLAVCFGVELYLYDLIAV